MGKHIKWSYELVKEFVESLGYELISKEYINNKTKIALIDKEGYYYETMLDGIISKQIPRKFDKSNSYTIYNIKILLSKSNLNLELLTEKYISGKEKIKLRDLEGYFYEIPLFNITKIQHPLKFSTSNSYTIQNINLWLKLNNKPIILLSKIYKGDMQKLKFQCLDKNCCEIFEMKFSKIQIGYLCPYCSGHQTGVNNCLNKKNPKLSLEWNQTKNGNITPYDVTCGSHKYVWWKCKEGHEWMAQVAKRALYNRGCPECNESKGEKKIKAVIDLNNIYCIPQKEYDGLIGLGNGNLSYDFYLPKYNLLIEYQGEQHEKPIDFKGLGQKWAKEQFKIQLEHDKRKREYAKNNNINLLEIWYFDFNNIEQILSNELNLNLNDIKLAI